MDEGMISSMECWDYAPCLVTRSVTIKIPLPGLLCRVLSWLGLTHTLVFDT